ncbi:Rieske 2Fe-2S domain-containing protein [Pelagibius litoralis]|uniref:Rieske 2Fe-2S domain-containing protein n=1 Tax=Pelagibius litoralis TaxID=374515 RepID=A0A967F128_9PROT|nr:Rieske 2Fe-2S domain-containing protein [Pelagibius litoralis]NIA71074.1 Rieske 2Fe-2S domain-containing protein [Pelagibius litoralis]
MTALAAVPSSGTRLHIGPLQPLLEKGRQIVKAEGKQIAVFASDKGVFACNNRCPHEGYPLMEGKLSQGADGGGCILTCNWHNWKFDLEGGETLVGGDKLRRYPVEIIDGEVWLDITDPPAEERRAAALESLRRSFRRHEYDRMAREISRLQAAGGDPLDALRGALDWTAAHFEFGTTHAHAGAPDWLALRDELAESDPEKLVPLLEVVGHLAWDCLREPAYPFSEGSRPYDAAALVAAIEAEDEAAAIALLRGALADGLGYRELEEPLAEAALAHYQDFGHSLIYVYKTGQLIERLGPASAEPLLLSLVRSLVYASREDLIPEFRAYGGALVRWDGKGAAPVAAEDLRRLSVPKVLERVLASSADRKALFDALLGAAAADFLQFDLTVQAATDGSVSHNVNWLDFTHAVTFSNAVRVLCSRHPRLWPQGLLQIACFIGRNAGYVDCALDASPWQVDDSAAFFDRSMRGLFDHAQPEYIVSVHLVKLLTAAREEIAADPAAPWVPPLLAAVNRFLHEPLKRKHTRRTAQQALSFVAAEG